jgi:hypothetical protein
MSDDVYNGLPLLQLLHYIIIILLSLAFKGKGYEGIGGEGRGGEGRGRRGGREGRDVS